MAISYVGGQVGSRAGSTSTTNITFSLSGGSNSTPQNGDYVVITVAAAVYNDTGVAQAVASPSGYTSIGELLAIGGTFDCALNVSRKFMGETPDTTFQLPSTGSIDNAQAYTVQVWRGVDPTTPDDVSPVSATGESTTQCNPASITPVTSGAYVLICGAGACSIGVAYTAPTNYSTNFLTTTRADVADCQIGSGYRSWSSGAEDPGTYGGGQSPNAQHSWSAYTIALRPAADPAGTSNGQATVSGVGRYLQIARPEADISNTGWKNEAAGASPLYSSVNEESDSTFIYSETHGDIARLRFVDLVDPSSDQWHAMPMRVRRPNGYGNLTARVKQGETTIATRTFSNIGTNWENVAFNLSGAEADALTDYGNVVVELENT